MLSLHEQYYLKLEEPNKSCLLALRDIILNFDSDITPEWKYGLPFFYYKKKMFCYFWKDKKTQEPYIGICRGNEIEHPLLKAGNRKRIKILRVNPNEDIDINIVKEILNITISTYNV